MTEFGKSVRKHFDFLISDFGFALTSDDEAVRYDAATLYVGIGSSKGEIDLNDPGLTVAVKRLIHPTPW